MVHPKVIEQGHNLLTEDSSLDGLVAGVHRVLSEAKIRVSCNYYIFMISWTRAWVISGTEALVKDRACFT